MQEFKEPDRVGVAPAALGLLPQNGDRVISVKGRLVRPRGGQCVVDVGHLEDAGQQGDLLAARRSLERLDELASLLGVRLLEAAGVVRRSDGAFTGGDVDRAFAHLSQADGMLPAADALSELLGLNIAGKEMTRAADLPLEARSTEGGLRANARVPLADLLSTFTGSWTLAELGAADRLEAAEVSGYAEAVERTAGGFRGGLWDEGVDVEYTFYGLGVLALFT